MLPSSAVPSPRTTSPSQDRVMRRNTYAVKIRGNALHDCNLFDGDVIIIRRFQNDADEETLTAEINQQEITLKKLSISRLGVHLLPADTLQPAMFLHNRDIQVLGLVMGINRHVTAH
ncbi:S24 family peptidase [Vreelandella rituensis]|uniref:Peptidase S24/S26A/S26B/S26C domain-containing protein n=1 Tax=Vreelandella rituensis TaxID=2282306 RepID=A0A368U2N8_9GAMM|nr:S24 family peptidase [Halomonas rituensis]RCV91370.1 hypothetical protein DU506_10660 [Halomonas rituensis]